MCRSKLSAVQVKYVISATSFGSTQCTRERTSRRSEAGFTQMAERSEAMSFELAGLSVAADRQEP